MYGKNIAIQNYTINSLTRFGALSEIEIIVPMLFVGLDFVGLKLTATFGNEKFVRDDFILRLSLLK